MVIQYNDNKDNEIWKDIPGYEGLYQVSNFGRVKSFPKKGNFKTTRILKGSIVRGYHHVRLSNGKKPRAIKVHKLVADAFLGKLPIGHNINHIDGVKINNHVDNLEYCTHSENIQHAYGMGLMHKGEKHGMAKLTKDHVFEIRKLWEAGGISQRELAKRYGVVQAQIWRIIKRESWKHI